MFGKRKSQDERGSAHGERPWVYFMVDSFFLVTQFFLLTFHVKVDEGVLPQKMAQGPVCPNPIVEIEQSFTVHVAETTDGKPYEFMLKRMNLDELQAAIANVRSAGQDCAVRVSYDGAVQWRDVIAVLNACKKSDIQKCGLIPLRHG